MYAYAIHESGRTPFVAAVPADSLDRSNDLESRLLMRDEDPACMVIDRRIAGLLWSIAQAGVKRGIVEAECRHNDTLRFATCFEFSGTVGDVAQALHLLKSRVGWKAWRGREEHRANQFADACRRARRLLVEAAEAAHAQRYPRSKPR